LVQNILPYNLLYRNMKIKVYRTRILPVFFFLYGCETWYLIQIEGHRMRMYETNGRRCSARGVQEIV